jgi:hypothetical protein
MSITFEKQIRNMYKANSSKEKEKTEQFSSDSALDMTTKS